MKTTTPRRTLAERLRLRNPPAALHATVPATPIDLSADEWRIVSLALQTQVMESTKANQWPKAEAAQRVLEKVEGAQR